MRTRGKLNIGKEKIIDVLMVIVLAVAITLLAVII
jgi:hypothetical protein